MVRRCGASSPDTLCLARVFFDACFPWLCRLFRCPWPLGAGIAAGGVSHHATPTVKARTKSASEAFRAEEFLQKAASQTVCPAGEDLTEADWLIGGDPNSRYDIDAMLFACGFTPTLGDLA